MAGEMKELRFLSVVPLKKRTDVHGSRQWCVFSRMSPHESPSEHLRFLFVAKKCLYTAKRGNSVLILGLGGAPIGGLAHVYSSLKAFHA